MEEKKMYTVELILDNGNVIFIEFPDDIMDDFLDEMRIEILNGKIWNVSNWINVEANYFGNLLDEINCEKVIGISY